MGKSSMGYCIMTEENKEEIRNRFGTDRGNKMIEDNRKALQILPDKIRKIREAYKGTKWVDGIGWVNKQGEKVVYHYQG